jgi:thiol-disulfide isomerase/thioredoxin
MIDVVLLSALLTAASAVFWLFRRRDGQFRAPGTRLSLDGARVSASELGHTLGGRATFVQFSSTVCATCPQVHGVLDRVASAHPGVAHVEVSAEDRPDLVRRLGIMRTPTVLLLDREGVITSRTTGAIRPEQAVAALGPRP